MEKYILLPILYSGGIMKNEIDNKRQDVEDCPPLHPYAGEETSNTAYLCAFSSIANFPHYFKGKLARTWVYGVVFSAV